MCIELVIFLSNQVCIELLSVHPFISPLFLFVCVCEGGSEGQGRIHQRFPEKDWEDNPFPQGLELVRASQTNTDEHILSTEFVDLSTIFHTAGCFKALHIFYQLIEYIKICNLFFCIANFLK